MSPSTFSQMLLLLVIEIHWELVLFKLFLRFDEPLHSLLFLALVNALRLSDNFSFTLSLSCMYDCIFLYIDVYKYQFLLTPPSFLSICILHPSPILGFCSTPPPPPVHADVINGWSRVTIVIAFLKVPLDSFWDKSWNMKLTD